MSVIQDTKTGLITIQTRHSTYQMMVDAYDHLLHLYYGPAIYGSAADLLYFMPRSHCANPLEAGENRGYTLDQLPLEYSHRGSADFRTAAFRMKNADGSYGCDLKYLTLSVRDGKYALTGLPSAKGEGAKTLEILLGDAKSNVIVHLLYGIYEEEDVITRSVVIENRGEESIVLEKVASCCLDFAYGDFDALTFYGRQAMERNVQRTRIGHGLYSVASLYGISSHFYNPFVILMEAGANEDCGNCYGVHFVYSGNFLAEAQKNAFDETRFVMGLNDEEFAWNLDPGKSFAAPECILSFSGEGLALLSHRLHDFIRQHIVRGPWQYRRKPVLINNWEATYFDFTHEKLLSIAKKAAALGVEMLVLDDGWFGKRNDDRSGLGDWKVNEEKLGTSLGVFSREIHELGLSFGLWFEPEMVSEDSDLYRAHPDYVLRIPGRSYHRCRNQLVLDFSRPEVVDNIFTQMCCILDSAQIEYVKWDMNRILTDVYSPALSAGRQGEVRHRYMLGVYDLLERITKRYPDLLIEGCSGGGGRFDCGMLCYTPQIWCSDNTDAADRCRIQYGTSFGYPPEVMGAHVSAVPNHQTGRVSPFAARAITAMAGTFGYELDPGSLCSKEAAMIPEQIKTFREDYETTHRGIYYRLTDPAGRSRMPGYVSYEESSENAGGELSAWMSVAKDGREAVVSVVYLENHASPNARYLRLKGLAERKIYHCRETRKDASGALLMHAGLLLPAGQAFEGFLWHFDCTDEVVPTIL